MHTWERRRNLVGDTSWSFCLSRGRKWIWRRVDLQEKLPSRVRKRRARNLWVKWHSNGIQGHWEIWAWDFVGSVTVSLHEGWGHDFVSSGKRSSSTYMSCGCYLSIVIRWDSRRRKTLTCHTLTGTVRGKEDFDLWSHEVRAHNARVYV